MKLLTFISKNLDIYSHLKLFSIASSSNSILLLLSMISSLISSFIFTIIDLNFVVFILMISKIQVIPTFIQTFEDSLFIMLIFSFEIITSLVQLNGF